MKTAIWLILAAASAFPQAGAKKKDSDVLITVNGVPVRRSELRERAWKEYSNAVLNEAVDEILVSQAAARGKLTADSAEVALRMKKIRGQFPDEKAFLDKLSADGTTPEGLEAQIARQVLRETLVVQVKNLSVSDAEVKEFFEANKEKLGSPDIVHVRQIVVASEKEAVGFLAALNAGSDFAKLASQVSLDAGSKDRGGDVGLIARGVMVPEIEKVIFALKPGEIGGPVKTGLVYQLFKVEEFRPAKPAVFEEVKADVKRGLLGDKITKAWPAYLRELHEKAKFEPRPTPPKP